MDKTITIATLIRNREFIIPYYLEYLYKLNYPKHLINILWIVNNSNDKSQSLLEQFKSKHDSEYNRIRIEEINRTGIPEDKRTSIRDLYIYKHLADLRNIMLSKVKTDYAFSIDSDILLTDPETINKLLSHNVDIVSSLIYNGYEFSPNTPHKFTNAMIELSEGFRHLSKLNIKQIVNRGESLLQEIDLTGAIYLISRKVLDNKNIKYAHDPVGEDAPFCASAKKQGFKLYIDLDTYNQHIMSQRCLDQFLKGELNNG